METLKKSTPIALIERLQRAMNTHDLEAFLDCFDPDYQSEQPVHPDRAFRGRKQVRKNWTGIFNEIPDFAAQVLHAAVHGDTIWTEWVWSGTRTDGTRLDTRGVILFGVRTGRFVSGRLYMEPVQTVSVGHLKQILELFNRHDLDGLMEIFAEACVLEMPRGQHPWGQRCVGKEQVRAGLASRFAGIPDVHYGDDHHWVAGNRGISEWMLTGTTTAGRRLEVRGCDLYQFRDGRVVRKDSYWKIVES